jgi:hypothetical protein
VKNDGIFYKPYGSYLVVSNYLSKMSIETHYLDFSC